MKYFYLSIALFFSFNCFGQDTSGLWFLHYIEIDGVEQYSTVPMVYSNPNSTANIFFNDDNTLQGIVCNNEYSSSYSIIDDATITINGVVALTGDCAYGTESNLFLQPYLWSVLANDGLSDIFNYLITGSGDDETLQLTNSQNNKAVYGRTPLPESKLPGVWYLHSISRNGNNTINTYNGNFKIEIKLYNGVFGGMAFDGDAVCNGYVGDYYLKDYVNQTIRIGYFARTLAVCSPMEAENFESSYYSFFDDYPAANFSHLNFEISGSDENESLILTDQDGDYLVYGRQTLSIDENTEHNLSIRLKENPVFSELNLMISSSLQNFKFQINSIQGKRIMDDQLLTNESIDVSFLKSGMYFLTVFSDDNYIQTIKFVKE